MNGSVRRRTRPFCDVAVTSTSKRLFLTVSGTGGIWPSKRNTPTPVFGMENSYPNEAAKTETTESLVSTRTCKGPGAAIV